MSGQTTGWLLRNGPRPDDLDREGKPYGLARARALRSVLAPIGDSANRDGENAIPGIDAIVEGSLYSRRQVYRVLDDAVAEGWIEVTSEATRGHRAVYRVNVHRRDTMAPQAEPIGVPNPDDWGAKSDAMGCHSGPVARQISHDNGTPDVLTVDTDGDTDVSSVASDSDAARLAHLLADLIEANGSKRPNVTWTWVQDIERLIRIDERTPRQVENMIRWCQADDFWRGNILSARKLRAKYDQLRLAAMRTNGNGHRPTKAERNQQVITDTIARIEQMGGIFDEQRPGGGDARPDAIDVASSRVR